MKCPTDGTTLAIADRQGIEIDYCPECRGVWLDRGELDKVIERSATLESPRGRDGDVGRPDTSRGKPAKKKKATSFLTELFELGG